MTSTTVHRTTLVNRCPANGRPDVYEAEFRVVDAVLPVEAIAAAIAELPAPLYQEEITRSLAGRLGCVVTTRGSHGEFATECTAEPAGCSS